MALGCLWLASLVLLVSWMVTQFIPIRVEYEMWVGTDFSRTFEAVCMFFQIAFYMQLPLVVNYMSVWASTRLVRAMAIASTAGMLSFYIYCKLESLVCKDFAKVTQSAEDAQLMETSYLVADVMRLFIAIKCIGFAVQKIRNPGKNILALEGSHLPTPQSLTLGKYGVKITYFAFAWFVLQSLQAGVVWYLFVGTLLTSSGWDSNRTCIDWKEQRIDVSRTHSHKHASTRTRTLNTAHPHATNCSTHSPRHLYGVMQSAHTLPEVAPSLTSTNTHMHARNAKPGLFWFTRINALRTHTGGALDSPWQHVWCACISLAALDTTLPTN